MFPHPSATTPARDQGRSPASPVNPDRGATVRRAVAAPCGLHSECARSPLPPASGGGAGVAAWRTASRSCRSPSVGDQVLALRFLSRVEHAAVPTLRDLGQALAPLQSSCFTGQGLLRCLLDRFRLAQALVRRGHLVCERRCALAQLSLQVGQGLQGCSTHLPPGHEVVGAACLLGPCRLMSVECVLCPLQRRSRRRAQPPSASRLRPAPSLPRLLAAHEQGSTLRSQPFSRANHACVSPNSVHSEAPWRRKSRITPMLAKAASLRGSAPA